MIYDLRPGRVIGGIAVGALGATTVNVAAIDMILGGIGSSGWALGLLVGVVAAVGICFFVVLPIIVWLEKTARLKLGYVAGTAVAIAVVGPMIALGAIPADWRYYLLEAAAGLFGAGLFWTVAVGPRLDAPLRVGGSPEGGR